MEQPGLFLSLQAEQTEEGSNKSLIVTAALHQFGINGSVQVKSYTAEDVCKWLRL